MRTTTKTEPIRLKYSEKESQVLVEPEDEDRFVLSVDEAIRACRIYREKEKLFRHQFEYLKNVLGGWVRKHGDKIDKAFLTLRNDRLFLLIITKGRAYDDTFENELIDLDLQIAREERLSEIRLNVQALPLCSEDNYLSFCNLTWMFEFVNSNA